ncbi:MAG: hypothetical protein ACNA8R_14450, partial [Nitriliruptoraceae bacterium]
SGCTELASRCLTERPFQVMAHLTAELRGLLTRPTFRRSSSAEDRPGSVNLIEQEADRSGSEVPCGMGSHIIEMAVRSSCHDRAP